MELSVFLPVFLIMTALSWVTLVIVVYLGQNLADLSVPPWPEAVWQLAIMAAFSNLATLLLAPLIGCASWAVGVVVLWVLLAKWFDMDMFGAVVLCVISWLVRYFLNLLLMGLFASWQSAASGG